MRLGDYLRLGAANITAHLRRAVKVVMIVGVLFGVMLMASMLIKGIGNTVLVEMNRPMDGKILLGTTVNTQYYKEPQTEEVERAHIEEKVRQYGGEVVETKSYNVAGQEMLVLPEEMVRAGMEAELAKRPAEAVPVIVPTRTAMEWLKIKVPQRASAEQATKLVLKAREQALGQTLELENGQKVYIVGLSSGWAARSSLELAGVGQDLNPLNLVLGVVPLGSSRPVIVGMAGMDLDEMIIKSEAPEVPEDWQEKFPELAGPQMETVWAAFPNLASAERYYYDAENYCEDSSTVNGRCGAEYKYYVTSGFNDPLAVEKVFGMVWLVFEVVAVGLMIIGVIVMLTTYLRLVGQDMKVIALYRANGATKGQVMGIYLAYLLMLSLLAAGFAVILGVALSGVVNLLNATALSQAFTMALGMPEQRIVLIGANKWLLISMVVMAVVAPVAVVMSGGKFSEKNLAKKLK